MNIYDIAEKTGVSIATVSRVLNDSPHVSEKTRRKVLKAITQAGYVPNAFARGLGSGSMRTVGLLCPDATDPYQAAALAYLEEAFRRRDYSCILACTGRTAADRTDGMEAMRNRKVDAMVLMGSSFGELDARGTNVLRSIAESMPVAMLNAECSVEQVYSVCCDDRRATREAVINLIQSGSRRILYLYHSDNRSGLNKLAGYRDALIQADLPVDERLIRMAGNDRDMDFIQTLIGAIREEGTMFDAVMTSEDMLAVAAAKYCIRQGIRVPEDVQIIGYNDLPMCRYSEP